MNSRNSAKKMGYVGPGESAQESSARISMQQKQENLHKEKENCMDEDRCTEERVSTRDITYMRKGKNREG